MDRWPLFVANDVKRFQPITRRLVCAWEPIHRPETA